MEGTRREWFPSAELLWEGVEAMCLLDSGTEMQACCTVFRNAMQFPVEVARRVGRLYLLWVHGRMQVAGTPGGRVGLGGGWVLRIACWRPGGHLC